MRASDQTRAASTYDRVPGTPFHAVRSHLHNEALVAIGADQNCCDRFLWP